MSVIVFTGITILPVASAKKKKKLKSNASCRGQGKPSLPHLLSLNPPTLLSIFVFLYPSTPALSSCPRVTSCHPHPSGLLARVFKIVLHNSALAGLLALPQLDSPTATELPMSVCNLLRLGGGGGGGGAWRSETGILHIYFGDVKGGINKTRRWEPTPVAHMLGALNWLLCTYFLI